MRPKAAKRVPIGMGEVDLMQFKPFRPALPQDDPERAFGRYRLAVRRAELCQAFARSIAPRRPTSAVKDAIALAAGDDVSAGGAVQHVTPNGTDDGGAG